MRMLFGSRPQGPLSRSQRTPVWSWLQIPAARRFYGPKISVQARDAIGRTWQMSTIQLDFNLPDRFKLEYVGSDGGRHQPIMIHRALFGSIERFFGVLTEHYAGHFPPWLAPVQAVCIPCGRRIRRLSGQLCRLAEEGGSPHNCRPL